MNYTVITDLHLHGPNPVKDVSLEYGEDVLYLGDNFEAKNVLKEDLPLVIDSMWMHNQKCIETKTINLSGNHEMMYGRDLGFLDEKYIPESQLLCFHGDKPLDPKYAEWRKQAGGKSAKMIALIKAKNLVTNALKKVKKKKKLSDKKADLLVNFALAYAESHGVIVKKIFIGHMHPSVIIRKEWKGIEIYVFPRGKSLIALHAQEE